MDTQKSMILILHSSAGHGHKNAAKAVEEACRAKNPSADIRCVDALDYAAPVYSEGYRKTYLFLIDRLPALWGLFYYFLDHPMTDAMVRPLRRLVNSVFGSRLERFVVSENPSVIVCTHFFPLEVVGRLKRSGKIRSRLGVVVTDYLPHYFWVEGTADFYVAAIEETKTALKERGVPESKVRVLGIPIESKFEIRRSRAEASASLGVSKDRFTVLLTSGGAGIGLTGEIAKRLLAFAKPLQVLAICGNNQTLFENLSASAKTDDRLKVFGFVKNMDILMEASDIVIGKSGGLTLTESLSKKKPMIILRPVPGQETRNADCAKLYRAGLVASSVSEAVELVRRAMENATFLGGLTEGAARMSRPRAARDIAQWIDP